MAGVMNTPTVRRVVQLLRIKLFHIPQLRSPPHTRRTRTAAYVSKGHPVPTHMDHGIMVDKHVCPDTSELANVIHYKAKPSHLPAKRYLLSIGS